ncbi:unnamed protein product, partial [Heterotrigona itama]
MEIQALFDGHFIKYSYTSFVPQVMEQCHTTMIMNKIN